MVEIKGRRKTSKDVSLKVEPIGQPVKMSFIEEILKTVEDDSPTIGMKEEKVYARFIYFLGTGTTFPSKLQIIQSERYEQGWRKRCPEKEILELDFGDYRLEYRIYEKEVFV